MRCIRFPTASLLLLCAITCSHTATSYAAQSIGTVDWDIHGNAAGVYDDNLTSRNEDPLDDYLTRLSIGVDLINESPNHLLQFTGDISQDIFSQYDDFNNNAQRFFVNFENYITKYDKLVLQNNFTNTEDPRNFEDTFGREEGRYRYVRNNFSARYIRELQKHLRLLIRYANEFYNPSLARIRESIRNQYGAGMEYDVTSNLTLQGDYEYGQREFNESQSASWHGVYGGWKYAFAERLTWSLKAGVDFLENFDGSNNANENIESTIGYDYSETTHLAIKINKSVTANAYSEDLFDQWNISASAQKELSERLSAQVTSFLYGEGEYERSGRKDEFVGLQVGFEYELTEDVLCYARYHLRDVDSSLESETYTKNTTSLGVQFSF